MTNLTSSSGNGGTFYLDSTAAKLRLEGTSTITNSQANLKGGLAYIEQASEVYIDQSTMSEIYSLSSGSVLYSLAEGSI